MEKKVKIDFETSDDIAGKRYKLNEATNKYLNEGYKLAECLVVGTSWAGAVTYNNEFLPFATKVFMTFTITERAPAGFATKEGMPEFARFKAKFRYQSQKTAEFPSFDVMYRYENKQKIKVHNESAGFTKLLTLIESQRRYHFITCNVFANITDNLSTKPMEEGGGDFGFFLLCDYNSSHKPPTGPDKGPPLLPEFTPAGIMDIEATKRKLAERKVLQTTIF